MWGSNAREAHPIFFHHVLKGVRRGARLYAVDPRRTTTAQWADAWLGIEVGSDISLANAIAREIIEAGLANETFVRRATAGFDAYAASVQPYTLDRASRDTGVPAGLIRQLAHDYARADRAQICWTLGITEHHNAADNVFALINLALLTGHVGRYGSGLVPLRGQNNVQGGGDMGAIPNKLTGFQDVETDLDARARFEAVYGAPIPPRKGWHLSQMFEAMEDGELTACYIIGENPLRSEADTGRARKLLGGLEHFVVQDMFLTDTAKLAHVVLPATATWCEAEGTVTNSERRVQRVRKALEPPPGARDDIEIICELARRLGTDWGRPAAEDLWNELRTLSPMHAGMSYRRLEDLGGIQWPCYDEQHPGELFLHARLWEKDPVRRGAPAPFTPVENDPPVDQLSPEFPLRLTTGRRLDSFNTGVQTEHYATPIRRPETLNLSPEDATRLGLAEGEVVRVSSRRGSLEVPVHIDEILRAGLAFMTLHFPDQVETNILTLDAWDPKSGTAEFKATAIRVDKLDVIAPDGSETQRAKAGG
jgi:formate dehydrogenase major subunit